MAYLTEYTASAVACRVNVEKHTVRVFCGTVSASKSTVDLFQFTVRAH